MAQQITKFRDDAVDRINDKIDRVNEFISTKTGWLVAFTKTLDSYNAKDFQKKIVDKDDIVNLIRAAYRRFSIRQQNGQAALPTTIAALQGARG